MFALFRPTCQACANYRTMKKSGIKSKSSKSGKGSMKSLKSKGSRAGSFGGASSSKSAAPKKVVRKEDAMYDLEQQFLLRLPPGPAIALKREVETGSMNLKDKLSIELSDDMRHGKVTYGGQMFSAKMVDLPTITECLKTTDRKTFYKTADIGQVNHKYGEM